MGIVTISPKYQVVIPQAIRELFDVQPGQKIQVIPYNDRIELIPLKAAQELRGFLRGIDTEVAREPDRV